VRAVETSYKLVEATRVAQQLAEEQLDAEQKKFNEGLSTNFQVLNYQEHWRVHKAAILKRLPGIIRLWSHWNSLPE
jgi:outer membrane protein TolC